VPCRTHTKERRRQIATRLTRIGGIDAFRLALTAIPNEPFLMGRLKPKEGEQPFRLTLDHLLKTTPVDVLAKLRDAALHDAPTAPTPAQPQPDLDERSSRLHAALERRVGPDVYGGWFKSVRVEDLHGDRLTVSVTSKLERDRIDQHYGAPLIDAARAALGTVERVDVTVRRATP
jgi:hypothetical protein